MVTKKYLHSDFDFISHSKKELNSRKRVRLIALHNIKEGVSISKIALLLKTGRNRIYDWIKRFNENGLDGLSEKAGRGRKSRLSQPQLSELIAHVEQLSKSSAGGRLVGRHIQAYVAEKFNVHYSLSHLYGILNRHNISWITSRSVSPLSDEQAKQNFKKNFLYR